MAIKKILLFIMIILLSSLVYAVPRDSPVFYDDADYGVIADNGWTLNPGIGAHYTYSTDYYISSPKSIKTGINNIAPGGGASIFTNRNMTTATLTFPVKASGYIQFRNVFDGTTGGFAFTVAPRGNGLYYFTNTNRWRVERHQDGSSIEYFDIPNSVGKQSAFYYFEEIAYNQTYKKTCLDYNCWEGGTYYGGTFAPNNFSITTSQSAMTFIDNLLIVQNASFSISWASPTPADGAIVTANVVLKGNCTPVGSVYIYMDNKTDPTTLVLVNGGMFGNFTVVALANTTYYYKGSCGIDMTNSSVRSFTMNITPVSSTLFSAYPTIVAATPLDASSVLTGYCNATYNSTTSMIANYLWDYHWFINKVFYGYGSMESINTSNHLLFVTSGVNGNNYTLGCRVGTYGIMGAWTNTTFMFTGQSGLTISVRNIVSQSTLFNASIIVTHPNGTSVSMNTGSQGYISLSGYTGVYNFTVTKTDYNAQKFSKYWDNTTLGTEYLDLNFNATIKLFEQGTSLPFNLSQVNSVVMNIQCPTNTHIINLTSNVQIVNINCSYSGISYVVRGANSSVSTYQKDALSIPVPGNYSIYLISPLSEIVNVKFIVDDLLNVYFDPRVLVKFSQPSGVVTVFESATDIENSVTVPLIKYQTYIIEVTSTSKPTYVFGTYMALTDTTVVIRLYNIPIIQGATGFTATTSWSTGTFNRTARDYAYMLFNDTSYNTTQIVWTLYENNVAGAVLYTTTTSSSVAYMEYDITPFMNSTIVSEVTFTYNSLNTTVAKIINVYDKIALPILQYFSSTFINFAILIVLGMLALSATVKTANIISIGLIGLSSLFIIFGWFTLGSGVLALSAIIAIVSLLKEGDVYG